MKTDKNSEIRARDLRRAVGARMHLVSWDAGLEPANEWVSASVDSPERIEHFKRWLGSKKIDASCEFVRFDSFSNSLQKFRWRQVTEDPALVFTGESWKMVSHDLRWIFDFMRGSVRFGALKEEAIQLITDNSGELTLPPCLTEDVSHSKSELMSADQIAAIRPGLLEAIDGPPNTCVTFEIDGDPDKWVQFTDYTINAAYPFAVAPSEHPIFSSIISAKVRVSNWEPGKFMTLKVSELDSHALARWIDSYFVLMLKCDSAEYDVNVLFHPL